MTAYYRAEPADYSSANKSREKTQLTAWLPIRAALAEKLADGRDVNK